MEIASNGNIVSIIANEVAIYKMYMYIICMKLPISKGPLMIEPNPIFTDKKCQEAVHLRGYWFIPHLSGDGE